MKKEKISVPRKKTFWPIERESKLTHEGSHREVYRDFQPSLTSFTGGAKD